jgi:predicted metalloprotease with PDZ domain
MKLPFALVSALVLAAPSQGQSNRDDLTPLEISYTTTVSEDLKSFNIDLEVQNIARPTLHVAMPNWMPGTYYIGQFGKRVQDLTATDSSGKALAVTQMDHQTWSIDTDGVSDLKVSYNLSSTRRRWGRTGESDAPVTGLRIGGTDTYLYVRGSKLVPVTSTYKLPKNWRVANGLLVTDDPMVYHARDYDTFADAPTILGIFKEQTFEVKGTPFRCVFFSNDQVYDFDIDAFLELVEKIVINQGQLYGSYPFPNYVFLFSLPGGGGLEHLNSTAIGLNGPSQKANPEAGASVTSHEFFHTWNVKRIRPETLGPFEYQHENYTGNLWVSEGWTSYFGDLTLARTGILTEGEFLSLMGRFISREQSKVRRLEHSVYWASRNVWHRNREETEPRVDYYAKGEMLGALIDLKIRHETDNNKSLNDVMRFFNRWFAEQNVGFKEGDVERACTAISNYDFAEFFSRHVYGTVDPPLAEYFAYAGIDYSEYVIPCSFPFSLRGTRIVGRRTPEGDAPKPGESIVKIAGNETLDPQAFLRQHQPGDTVTLTLAQGETEREVEVTLLDKPKVTATLKVNPNATEKQNRIRHAWLNSVD